MSDEKYDPVTGQTYVVIGGQKLYVSNNGQQLTSSPAEKVAEDLATEDTQTKVSAGNCGQSSENLK